MLIIFINDNCFIGILFGCGSDAIDGRNNLGLEGYLVEHLSVHASTIFKGKPELTSPIQSPFCLIVKDIVLAGYFLINLTLRLFYSKFKVVFHDQARSKTSACDLVLIDSNHRVVIREAEFDLFFN
jgi:hypothetical protein